MTKSKLYGHNIIYTSSDFLTTHTLLEWSPLKTLQLNFSKHLALLWLLWYFLQLGYRISEEYKDEVTVIYKNFNGSCCILSVLKFKVL